MNIPISHGQYHGCWWPDDARSQGISNHGVGLIILWCLSSFYSGMFTSLDVYSLNHNVSIHHCVLRFTLKKDKNIPISNSQYHSCWWPGDARSQSISIHDIDLVLQEYSTTERLTHRGWDNIAVILQTTFSNPFCWIKIMMFSFRFHCSLFPKGLDCK